MKGLGAGMANEQTRGTTDFATQNSDSGTDVKGRAREAVSQAKDRAAEKIESRIVDSKSRAAETLSGVASTLMSSSAQLREQNQEGAGRAIERAAEGVERFANYLQQTNVDEVVDQVHEFARRQPAAFIGGAFALGFLASRFIKATTPGGSRNLPALSDTGRGYNTSYDTTRRYETSRMSENYNTGYNPGDTGVSGSGYGNSGDTSGSLGYGAGLSTTGGGTTGGGYNTTGTSRSADDLGDGRSATGRNGGTDGGSR